MNEAEIESDVVRLLQGGGINALVFNERELAAIDRLVARNQVRKIYVGAVGLMGVPRVELVRI